jgi:hypothetical protein
MESPPEDSPPDGSPQMITESFFLTESPIGTGIEQTFNKPAGVTELEIRAVGGQGAHSQSQSSPPGGYGADISGTLTGLSSSEQTYKIFVGGEGSTDSMSGSGGGGGGASYILDSSNNLILISGGGGGESNAVDGGVDAMPITGLDATTSNDIALIGTGGSISAMGFTLSGTGGAGGGGFDENGQSNDLTNSGGKSLISDDSPPVPDGAGGLGAFQDNATGLVPKPELNGGYGGGGGAYRRNFSGSQRWGGGGGGGGFVGGDGGFNFPFTSPQSVAAQGGTSKWIGLTSVTAQTYTTGGDGFIEISYVN